MLSAVEDSLPAAGKYDSLNNELFINGFMSDVYWG